MPDLPQYMNIDSRCMIFLRCMNINSRCMTFRNAWFSAGHKYLPVMSDFLRGMNIFPWWVNIYSQCMNIDSLCINIDLWCMTFRNTRFSAGHKYLPALPNFLRGMNIFPRCLISCGAWISTRNAWIFFSWGHLWYQMKIELNRPTLLSSGCLPDSHIV